MDKKILLSWLGVTDLKAAGQIPTRPDEAMSDGPILSALKTLQFDELHLLHDQAKPLATAYMSWLAGHSGIKVILCPATLSSPIDFGDIHWVVDQYLQQPEIFSVVVASTVKS